MKRCCIADDECDGKIEWHHCWIYRGRQISERFAILPVCHKHHMNNPKEVLEYISLLRATEEELSRYPKYDWKQRKQYLESIIKDKLEGIT